MDVDQLRSFDRIIRDGSFTKAAARLNVTQATISARIRTLEDQVGGPLLTRGRKVELTERGATFLPYARRVL
ncbi:MAG: LysR family transcriptional regulator [Rhizobiales bacterium]|nr:LysR family transcriptional regulator [Hyphomicrobiales bacterium]